jgi:predicted flap endonuclease-1-like 5' DNA nuclease/type II secretory pathway pseudopilin PulG
MPGITAASIALIIGSVAVGALAGWVARTRLCAQEKTAVGEGWQQQLEAQRNEHGRLLQQNRTLMEQNSQLQASGKDATNRARELSDALKEAFERRDQLQRQLKETRSNHERAIRQRDELQSNFASSEKRCESARVALQEKDAKIDRLRRELGNWQNRLPPLIERYRERDGEARKFEEALAAARARIEELERGSDAGTTRIEPVDQEKIGNELDASNDPTNISYTGLERVLAEQDDADTAEDPADTRADRDSAETDTTAGAEDAAEPGTEAGTAAVAELPREESGSLRDNLRLIKGIGPTIEKTLNELGIFRFHQIAEMSEYDIYRVARRLKGFSTRIHREDWIGQARSLQLQQSGT